jgi:hypothetical protein
MDRRASGEEKRKELCSWYCQGSGIRVTSGLSLQLGWYYIVMFVVLVLLV